MTGVQTGALPIFVQHGGTNRHIPSIAQQKARQEVRIRRNNQMMILKQMQIDQLLLTQQQRRLVEQQMQRQSTQSRNQKLLSRQQEARENQKRAILKDGRISGQNQTVQRAEETVAARDNRRNRREQSVKEEYPALLRYYRSLNRQILREQNDPPP